jgi:Holliday junction DNA helicase RuvA
VHRGPVADDALSALVNLGYPRPIAQKAIEAAIEKDPSAATGFEALFRAAMSAIR